MSKISRTPVRQLRLVPTWQGKGSTVAHNVISRKPGWDPSWLLKSTPPRAVRGFLDRSRLSWNRLERSGTQVITLLAPTGYGKTALLVHWRRQALARGALVFWHTADARDDPMRLVRGLAHSAQSGSGRRGFGIEIMQWIESNSDPREALTGWLAEVAALAVEVVLLLDDVDSLPAAACSQVLSYLLGNAPANLRIALAARPTSALMARGTLSTASLTRASASDLRFTLQETLAVLSTAMGGRCNPDAGLRLHELTEGWPLGVQLAVAALHRGGNLEDLLGAATEDIRRYFVDTVIDQQSQSAVHLLVRMAQFDLLFPALCKAIFGRNDVEQDLLRIQDETPLLLRGEGGEWLRLHPLAREVLRERLAQVPLAERQSLSMLASRWYADQGMIEEAAEHAFFAGDVDAAISLVERHTHQMTVYGRSSAVLAWYQRLSQADIRLHPGFWAPAAWALAMSDRHEEARPLIDLILAQEQLTLSARFEATLISMTAAAFADRLHLVSVGLAQWPEPLREINPADYPVYLVSKGMDRLYAGHPDQARLQWARIAACDTPEVYSPVSYGFADYGTGLSYLWEGKFALTEQFLRPALARAEERMHRSNPVACMLAAILAEACWERGNGDEPRALLAGRLDVLERLGLPESLTSAYRVMARIADDEGRQDQALDLLVSLRAIGESRAMIRMQVDAQLEIVCLHARHGRADTALAESARLDTMILSRSIHTPASIVRWLELRGALAAGQAALAQTGDSQLASAQRALEVARDRAEGLRREADAVHARLLHSRLLLRQGSRDAHVAMSEAVSLGEASGMLRLVQALADGRERKVSTDAYAPERAMEAQPTRPRSLPARSAGMLTLKEREVLVLMSRSLSNKEIALAMDIGEQTIKWHVKNLFGKLNAASRRHAVARARILGLIDNG
jgi:LuxR family transcriptional regulator, maltose regulon positive regulatory protein